MRLLITRPEDDASALAAHVKGLGHEPVVLPLLQIVPRDGVQIPHKRYQAICVSSANALRGGVDLSQWHATPLFAVGPQSGAAARTQGFTRVSAKGGNVDGLAAAVVEAVPPAGGPILYLSGAETTGDLEGKLRELGFAVDRIIVYDAVPTRFPSFKSLLEGIDGVLLYSPRTARLWHAAVLQAAAEPLAQAITCYCLSTNVAAALPQNWPKRISPAADENGMLRLLERSPEAE